MHEHFTAFSSCQNKKGNKGLLWGKQKGDVGGKPLKAVESCALYLKAFKSFYILYYFFIIVAVYR
jgi:hypothetical protein